MRNVYATTYQTDKFCAAFRHGVLMIVRLKDNASCILSLADTNHFRRRLMDYELSDSDENPIDRACVWHVVHMKKRKAITALYSGAVITYDTTYEYASEARR